MSHLQYIGYEGFGDRVRGVTHYSQAVRIGDKIEISGQETPLSVSSQVNQAFANVQLALRSAGGNGWSQVYKVRAYYAPFTPEAAERTVENPRGYCPGHQPLFTGVGVRGLYAGMGVGVEVEAHVGG